MPLDTSTIPSDDELKDLGDPDNPIDDRAMVAKLTVTARVDIGTSSVVPSYGAEDNARILEICRNYAEKASNYQFAVWFLEAEGISVVRTDGQPFRQHEVIKIQSSEGKNLGKNMTHGKLAEAFNALGVSASYAKAGQEDSAYGRVFHFKSNEVKLGKSFTKSVNLWPVELFDPDWTYDGENPLPRREVTPKTQDDEGVPTDGGASANGHISEPEAVDILKQILHGKAQTEMLDLILAEPRLRGIPSVFGVPLIEAATDESLAAVLSENKAMTISGGGVLQTV